MRFNEPFEGHVNYMYLDIKGLVSTGVGNLIDPAASALVLPWLRSDMQRATQAEILAAWNVVKSRSDLKFKGGGAFRMLTPLRLTESAISQLCASKLVEMCKAIQAAHPKFSGLPADAQLAVLSMAWAMGPAFRFPKFWAAIEAARFLDAAEESHMEAAAGGTLVKRNIVNKLLLVNADRVVAHGLDPDVLVWPKVLPPTPPEPVLT